MYRLFQIKIICLVISFVICNAVQSQSTRLSDFASCAPMDIVVANDGAIQIFKNGVGQFFNSTYVPPSPAVDNSIVLAFDTTEIGKGNGDFSYCDHSWTGTVSGVSGTGSDSDPWLISASLTSTYPGASIHITYSYVNGSEEFGVSITPTIPNTNTSFVKLYQCIDTYLNGSDEGAAYVLGNTPHIFMGVEATSGGLYEGFLAGNNQWDHFASEFYYTVNKAPENGGDLSDNLNFNSSNDNGMGVQWDLGIVQGVQPTIEYKIVLTTDVPLPKEICGNGLDDNIDGRIDEEYPVQIEENLILWAKADEGFSAGTWLDQSPEGNHGTNVNSPVSSTALNYNPGITYNGANFTSFPLPELQFESGDNHVTIFCVYNPATNATNLGVFGNQDDGLNNIILSNGAVGDGSVNMFSDPSLFGSYAHLLTMVLDEEDNVEGFLNSSKVRINGIEELSFTFDENLLGGVDPNFHLGKAGSNASSLFFDGEIMEILVYYENNGNLSISSTDLLKIESYLALKYGISLPNDYVSNP